VGINWGFEGLKLCIIDQAKGRVEGQLLPTFDGKFSLKSSRRSFFYEVQNLREKGLEFF